MDRQCKKYHVLYCNNHQVVEVGGDKSLVCYKICTPYIVIVISCRIT